MEDVFKMKGNYLKWSWGDVKYLSGEYFVRVGEILERAKLFGCAEANWGLSVSGHKAGYKVEALQYFLLSNA